MLGILHIVKKLVIGGLVVLLLIAGVSLRPAWQIWNTVKSARSDIAQAQTALHARKDFVSAGAFLNAAAQQLQQATVQASHLQPVRFLPWVGARFKAGERLLRASGLAADAFASMTMIVGKLYEPLQAYGPVRIGEIPVQEREALLRMVSEATPELQGVKAELAIARDLIEATPRLGMVKLDQEIALLYERIKETHQALTDGLPFLEIMPQLLGFPRSQAYLFVLENSDELRPTGGFIGTYGTLTLDAGHITYFATDDVYNLDRQVDPRTRPHAPEPLAKYLGQSAWYLRDANWSPDFPTSAKTISQFYQEEKGTAETLAGVIAIMPEAIKAFLQLTGPLTVRGQTFNAENLTDVLEYEVEIGFAHQGIPRPQRKELVSELGHALIARLFDLPTVRWSEILHLVRVALDEKHILLFSQEPGLQELLERNGWAGALARSQGDYLSVMDANLFSLKTDPYVPRSIFYTVRMEGERVHGEVELVYSYPRSGPSWKTKGYRTWTRIYVPKGSTLISSRGAMLEEGSKQEGSVVITEEHDKTVFGVFLAVQVGEVKRLQLRYELPEQVANAVRNGGYELYVQKQPGTVGHPLTVSTDFGKVPRLWSPRGLQVAQQQTRLTWQSSLTRDQQFRVEF